MKHNLAVIAGCFVAGIACSFLPGRVVTGIAGDLIATFAILAGLLAQMIALTAVIFEPGRMSSEGVREVGQHVDGLQKLNIGLFAIYLIAIALMLVVKATADQTFSINIPWTAIDVELLRVVLFSSGFVVALAIVRTFKTMFAIRRLQMLRTDVQARDAEAREKAAREASVQRLRPVPDQGGAEYGTVVTPPGGRRTGPKARR